MEIQVTIETPWDRDEAHVWVYGRTSTGNMILNLATLTWTPVEFGARLPEPSLRIPREVLKPLAQAMANHTPPDRALENHLMDALSVRDRLLSIVEHGLAGYWAKRRE